jgi:hypothetical protein
MFQYLRYALPSDIQGLTGNGADGHGAGIVDYLICPEIQSQGTQFWCHVGHFLFLFS